MRFNSRFSIAGERVNERLMPSTWAPRSIARPWSMSRCSLGVDAVFVGSGAPKGRSWMSRAVDPGARDGFTSASRVGPCTSATSTSRREVLIIGVGNTAMTAVALATTWRADRSHRSPLTPILQGLAGSWKTPRRKESRSSKIMRPSGS